MPTAVATQSPAEATVIKQQAVLDKIIANTSGTITSAFATVIADVMPSAAAFRDAYTKEQTRLQDASDSLGDTVDTAPVSLVWLHTSGYLDKLLAALQASMDKAAKESAEATQTAQQQAANAGATLSQQAVAQSAGVPTSQVQPVAPQQVVDSSSADDGVDETVDALPSNTKQNAQKSLIAGVASGLGGQVLMMGLQTVIQEALTSMLGMGGNAAIGAMRQSMMMTILQNQSIVNGWIWTCEGGACIACLEMDGSVHGWDEDLSSHSHCACLQLPYSGPPIDDLGTGDDWFNALDDAAQQEILGPAKYEAWASGDVQLMDFVSNEGGYIHERSLKSLGLDFRDYLQQLPTKSELREIPEIVGPHGPLPALSQSEFEQLVAPPVGIEIGGIEAKAATEALDMTANADVKFIAEKDVAAWTAGNAADVPATGWHYGTEGHIDRLMQNGVDVARNRIGVYGRGFYIWNGELPEAALEGDKGAEIAVHMENPFHVQWDDYSLMEKIAEEHPDWATTPEWEDVGGGVTAPKYERLFAEEIQRQGYDGVLVYRDGKVQEEVAIKAGTVRVVNDERAAAEAAARDYAVGTAKAEEAVAEVPGIKEVGEPGTSMGYQITDEGGAGAARLNEMVGRDLTPDEIGHMVGLQQGDSLHLIETRAGLDRQTEMVMFSFSSQDGVISGTRGLYRDAEGNLVMENFGIKSTVRGEGLGARYFGEEVQSLSDMGVDRIETGASGSAAELALDPKSPNGFYTWARFGYDTKLADLADAGLDLNKLHEAFPGVDTLQDLILAPGGPQWWKANGVSFRGVFDLADGSPSRQILDGYLQAKGVEIGGIEAKAATDEGIAQAAEGASNIGVPLTYTLPEIDRQAEAQVIQAAQDALSGDGVASHTDAIALGSQIHDYLDERIGPIADYGNEAVSIRTRAPDLTEAERAWVSGDNSAHGGIAYRDAEQMYGQALRDETLRVMQQVREVGGTDLEVLTDAKTDQKVVDAIREAQDVFPKDWLDASNGQGGLFLERLRSTSAGGYYDAAYHNGTGIITARYTKDTPPEELFNTAVHELGHRMEDVVDGIWLDEKTFYNLRTAGEDYVDLTTAVTGKTKLDAWAWEYVGKEPIKKIHSTYLMDATGNKLRNFSHYEMLSLGVEWTLGKSADAVFWLSKDEEFHKFILGLLFGAKDHVV